MPERERERRNLQIFSTVFLIIAAADIVNLIATFAGGELNVQNIAEMASTTANVARASVIATTVVVALVVLVLVYLGVMGLRQCKGKPTGASHITVAKIAVVFLSIALLMVIISFFNTPDKDWVALCSSAASVLIGVYYIRAAKALM